MLSCCGRHCAFQRKFWRSLSKDFWHTNTHCWSVCIGKTKLMRWGKVRQNTSFDLNWHLTVTFDNPSQQQSLPGQIESLKSLPQEASTKHMDSKPPSACPTLSSDGHRYKYWNVAVIFFENLGPKTSLSVPNWCRDCRTMESMTYKPGTLYSGLHCEQHTQILHQAGAPWGNIPLRASQQTCSRAQAQLCIPTGCSSCPGKHEHCILWNYVLS